MDSSNIEKEIYLLSPKDDNILPRDISSYNDSNDIFSIPQTDPEIKIMKMQGIITISTSDITDRPEQSPYMSNSIIDIFPKKIIKYQSNPCVKVKRRNIIFSPVNAEEIQFSRRSTFGYIKCKMITTYFFGRISYSEFTNPQIVEKEGEIQLVFLYQKPKKNSNDKFSLEIIEEALSNSTIMSISNINPFSKFGNIDPDDMIPFINQLNNFFYENEYIQAINSYSQNNFCYLLLMVICTGIILLDLVFISCKFTSWHDWRTIVSGVLIVLLLFLLWFSWKKKKTLLFKRLESELNYRFKTADKIQMFIDNWNNDFFIKYGIYMWVPLSLNYVMFNMDLNQEIQIKSHQLEELNSTSNK